MSKMKNSGKEKIKKQNVVGHDGKGENGGRG